jgi:hypothetical protein
MGFNRTTKDVIWDSVINYNSFKLMHDTVIPKDREKNKELIFFVIARHLSKSKKGLLLFLIVRSKIGVDCEKKLSIWKGPNIKRDINM